MPNVFFLLGFLVLEARLCYNLTKFYNSTSSTTLQILQLTETFSGKLQEITYSSNLIDGETFSLFTFFLRPIYFEELHYSQVPTKHPPSRSYENPLFCFLNFQFFLRKTILSYAVACCLYCFKKFNNNCQFSIVFISHLRLILHFNFQFTRSYFLIR